MQRIGAALVGRQRVVLEIGRVGRQHAVPAPDPVVVQRELAGRVDAAAEEAVARILVARIDGGKAALESSRIELEAEALQAANEMVLDLDRAIGSDLHMDYTAVGQTTHVAARMEQMALPGSILLSAETLRLAEGYIEVRSMGPTPVVEPEPEMLATEPVHGERPVLLEQRPRLHC